MNKRFDKEEAKGDMEHINMEQPYSNYNYTSEKHGDQSNEQIDFNVLIKILLRRRKIIFSIASFIFIFSVLYTGYRRIFKPVYLGSFTLLISDPLNNQVNQGSSNLNVRNGLFEELARNTTKNDSPTLIELLKSDLLISPIATEFNIETQKLQKSLSIASPLSGQDKFNFAKGIIEVKLTGRNSRELEKILDSLSQSYLDLALDQRKKRVTDGLAFLNRQAPELEYKLQSLQQKLASFREKNNLIEPSIEGQQLKQNLFDIQEKIFSVQSSIKRLKNVKKLIQNSSITASGFQEAIGGDFGQSGRGLVIKDVNQKIIEEIISYEAKLVEAKSIYKEDSKIIVALENRLASLRPKLQEKQIEAVDTALNFNQKRLNILLTQKDSYDERFLSQPNLIKQYEQINQELQIAKENLMGLVSAREKFQLEMAQKSVPWTVIAPPSVETVPILPSIPKNLAFGGLISLIFSISIAIIIDRRDFVFHYSKDVRDKLKVPIIGEIPYVEILKDEEFSESLLKETYLKKEDKNKNKEDLKKLKLQRFFYQEAFRNLCTSIKFLNNEKPIKRILVSSAVPSEGKSLISSVLSKTYSDMGKKVLLIDGDLRKPKIHSRFGIDNLIGLTDILANEVKWEETTVNVEGFKNFDVITSGSKAPDPTRLLGTSRMDRFLNDASTAYDIIIIDSTPVLGLADSILSSSLCDGILFVVSLDKVNKNFSQQAVNVLIKNKINILGLTVNSLKEKSRLQSGTKYGYGYGYGYGYRYGYGYGEDEYASASLAYANADAKDNNPDQISEENKKQRASIYESLKDILSNLAEWLKE